LVVVGENEANPYVVPSLKLVLCQNEYQSVWS